MMEVIQSHDFPPNIKLLVAGTQKSFTVQEGLNHIIKRPNSEITVQLQKADYLENNQMYENAPETLAILDAKKIRINDTKYTSLELQAVDSFIVIERSSGTAVALKSDSQKKVYCLGDGDIIQFPASTNASLTVTVPKLDEIQVGSSVPEIETSISHTPKASTSLEVVSETPTVNRLYSPLNSPTASDAMPFSTAKAKVTQDVVSISVDGDQASITRTPAHDAEVALNRNNPSDIDNNKENRSTTPTTSVTKLLHNPDTTIEQDVDMVDDDDTQSESQVDEDELLHCSAVTYVRDSPKKKYGSRKRRAQDERSSQLTKKARPATASPIASDSGELDDRLITGKNSGLPEHASIESTIDVKPRSGGPMVVIDQRVRRSKTPPSTATSTRSTTERTANAVTAYQGSKPTVVFSSSGFDGLPTMLKRFRALATVSDTVTGETDILCLGKGELKTTSKLLLAVALGKQVLSDEWAIQSAESNSLLDPAQFIARDADKEVEWNLPANWSSGWPRTTLLSKHDVLITPQLKKKYGQGYKDIEKIIKILGASKITSSSAGVRNFDGSPTTIVLGLATEDNDSINITGKGFTCYDKDALPISILRGRLSLDEHKIDFAEKKAGRKKNS